MREHDLGVIPGDGIGPEVVAATLDVLDAAESEFGFTTRRRQYATSAARYRETGELWSEELERDLRSHDALLFGALGDPSVPPGVLERGVILTMRTALQQAVNVRPVRLYPGATSPLRHVTPENCDLVILRENLEGAYAAPGALVHAGTPRAVAVQESITTGAVVERIVEAGFRLAMRRRRRLTLCHKTNILIAAGTLWSDVVAAAATRYPEVEVDYVHVDAMCLHLPMDPGRFDVVVTDNLFGDIITDLGAMVQGGLGYAASANLNLDGSAPSMFEAVHGSAPDIAGRGIANPVATILSLAMCLAHLGEVEAALAVEAAALEVAAGSVHSSLGTRAAGERIAASVVSRPQPLERSVMSDLAHLVERPVSPTAA